MGTNYYCRKIPTATEMKEMQQALTERQYDKLQSLINAASKEYHIGKRSYGWQFIFAPHINRYSGYNSNGYYDKGDIVSPWEETLESIKLYLSREDVEIYDEYGNKFSFYDFWNDEIGDSLFNDPDMYINGADYHNKYPDEPVIFSDTEFTTEEGLRFSTDEDFC